MKVQTRVKLEQKIITIKNEQFRTIKKTWPKIIKIKTELKNELKLNNHTQPAFACSKSTMEKLEQCVKSVQSQQ